MAQELCGLEREGAAARLERADGEVKLPVVMHHRGLSAAEARAARSRSWFAAAGARAVIPWRLAEPAASAGLVRAMLLALLLLTAVQDPSAVAPRIHFGHLRHVQLLEPREGRVRFATQVEIATKRADELSSRDSAVCVYEGGPLPEGERQEPVAELAVGNSMLRPFTWTNRPSWFLFELEGATRLAALEPLLELAGSGGEPGALRILDFPSGKALLELGGVQEIEDACVRAGRGELLARIGKRLAWLRLAADGSIAERRTLDPKLDVVLAATIVRGDASGEPRGWCVGLRGATLTVVPFSTAGVDARASFELRLHGGDAQDAIGSRTTLRLAAWGSAQSTFLAVAWPHYDRGVGRVEVLDLGGEEPVALWGGRPDPESSADNRSDQCDYGQSLAFVPDAGGDGVPELLVSGPWAFLDETHVDLLSGRTGELVARFAPGSTGEIGHWLSVSLDGTRALVGGTEFRSMPEDLMEAGRAFLLELPSMKPLADWTFEREGMRTLDSGGR